MATLPAVWPPLLGMRAGLGVLPGWGELLGDPSEILQIASIPGHCFCLQQHAGCSAMKHPTTGREVTAPGYTYFMHSTCTSMCFRP